MGGEMNSCRLCLRRRGWEGWEIPRLPSEGGLVACLQWSSLRVREMGGLLFSEPPCAAGASDGLGGDGWVCYEAGSGGARFAAFDHIVKRFRELLSFPIRAEIGGCLPLVLMPM